MPGGRRRQLPFNEAGLCMTRLVRGRYGFYKQSLPRRNIVCRSCSELIIVCLKSDTRSVVKEHSLACPGYQNLCQRLTVEYTVCASGGERGAVWQVKSRDLSCLRMGIYTADIWLYNGARLALLHATRVVFMAV